MDNDLPDHSWQWYLVTLAGHQRPAWERLLSCPHRKALTHVFEAQVERIYFDRNAPGHSDHRNSCGFVLSSHGPRQVIGAANQVREQRTPTLFRNAVVL